jgi:hypothetical protein
MLNALKLKKIGILRKLLSKYPKFTFLFRDLGVFLPPPNLHSRFKRSSKTRITVKQHYVKNETWVLLALGSSICASQYFTGYFQ